MAKRRHASAAAATSESYRTTSEGQPGKRKPPAKVSKPSPLASRLAALRRLTGWRQWAVNLCAGLVIPALILLALEGSLRLFGFRFPTSFCLRQNDLYTQNDKFLWAFYSKSTNLRPNPFAVAVHKAEAVVRVLVIGESAAAGTPDPAFSFSRILERMLRHHFPQGRVEVINGAMRGVNSHILLPDALLLLHSRGTFGGSLRRWVRFDEALTLLNGELARNPGSLEVKAGIDTVQRQLANSQRAK
jgi:hypothetical protein